MSELGWLLSVISFVIAVALALILWRVLAQVRREREGRDVRLAAELDALRQTAQAGSDALRADAEREVEQAMQRSRQILADAELRRSEMDSTLGVQRGELREERASQERREARLHEREDRLTADAKELAGRLEKFEEQRAALRSARAELDESRSVIAHELERVAGLSRDEAYHEVIAEAERQAKLQATSIARDIESTARRDADKLARSIIVTAIQRVASEQTNESVVSSVNLPSDEMKGRIIGREGRNIRAFEQITGVNLLIDDTPESVLLSSFDPVRRETARLTLVDLVADGRIHPARIEEVYERSQHRMVERIERAAEDALAEVGIVDLHPDLIPILGALAFRTSYGQNVLRHLVESAHLAGVMAAELGLNVAVVKRAAFLHDIGKALTHEVEGPHALIGAELLRKYGEDEDIVHAVEAHHNEVEPHTVEAVLVQAADAISGSRPGARRESLEAYVERMENLEHIATSHEGVVRAYAMQAGREMRVMVAPEAVDDAGAHALARDIAMEVEKNLSYPGQIRITVVRESRATETAH